MEKEIENNKLRKIEVILIVLLCLFSIGVGVIIERATEDIKAVRISLFENRQNNSFDAILSDTYSLNKEFRAFFHYNISRLGEDITEEELMSGGGTCVHATDWYNKRMEEKGYYTKEISIVMNKTMRHEFLIASNEKGYCLLDQGIYECWEMG
jgi:hypothetical protein